MENKNDKKRFMCYELGLLSLKAALSTRNSAAPVYAKEVMTHQRKQAKKVFRGVLAKLESLYADGQVSEEQHTEFIKSTADEISERLGGQLYEARFRIGISQKLINLHLKYLWSAGFIQEPPHCPIDGIIRNVAKINYDWTVSDSIEDYRDAIFALKKVANNRSLSVWELEEFRRRDEE